MKIEILDKLLKEKDENAKAWVDKKIHVVFNAKSKVYSYSGTIYKVAEQLDLIPEVDIIVEAEKVAAQLKAGIKEVEAPLGLLDTIRYFNSDLIYASCRVANKDEYDRQLAIYFIDQESSKWF